MQKERRSTLRTGSLIVIGLALTLIGVFAFKTYERNAHRWVPGYLWAHLNGTHPSASLDEARHLIFILVDHHEHPTTEAEAIRSAQSWAERYRNVVNGITDDYGRAFQYSWFYPYDGGRTPGALLKINELVFEGLGEIEFHWHNGHVPSDQFAANLKRGISWFHSIGALRSFDEAGKTSFGYIAGNWGLDNGYLKKSGPSWELNELAEAGCFADFTFSNTSVSQPKMFSSIYYAVDDARPKSYDTGVKSKVGQPSDGLMIFQGPSSVDLRDQTIEIGAIESWYGTDWAHRIKLWLENSPYVEGKPQWRFVRLYTHGVQSESLILDDKFRELLLSLKAFARDNDLKLHFANARQAYNLVKAAEAGRTEDPNELLDFEIVPPVNAFVHVDQRVEDLKASEHSLSFKAKSENHVRLRTHAGPIIELQGAPTRFDARVGEANVTTVDIAARESVTLAARGPLSAATGTLSSMECAAHLPASSHCYRWQPDSSIAAN